ncbi:MAG: endonuclease III [archaeon]
MEQKLRAKKVFAELKSNYKGVPLLFLNYKTDAQMLCSIILSAQSTDKQVNKVTEKLFKKYKTVNDFASANLKTFEQEVRATGYYRQKAKRVIGCFKIIRDKYKGKLPSTMEELVELPGVGRKTANLVLANRGIVEGIAVDTHVWRLAQRLGFSKADDQHKIERDLMEVFDKKIWHELNGLLISHGRAICTARNPKCAECFLNKKRLCPRVGV